MKISRWRHQNQLKIEPRSPKIALRSSFGAIFSKKNSQERPRAVLKPTKRAQECAKRANLGDFSKKNSPGGVRILHIGGGRRSRGGRWRGKGRQAPRVRREYESTKHYLERFAPDVNVGCGGLNSLRATAAPLLESEVGGTALLASFRCAFAGFRHVCAGFRRVFEGKSTVSRRTLEG